jgi:hypothetical protein
MVWDLLSQWNQTDKSVAIETTPVLFAGGHQGQVMRLVVETFPGPGGLVTPNWWMLGLCSLKTGNQDRFLPAAVQRVIRLAAARAPGFRFRWHLDADGRDPWMLGLDGCSIEAPAAVATLAVLEQFEECQQQPAKKVKPILDPQSVVTGVVNEGSEANPLSWPITPVNQETLSPKLAAAVKYGLDLIGVPATQRDGLQPPRTVRVEEVPTVGDALSLLRGVNRAFDRYRQYWRSKFKDLHEEISQAVLEMFRD